MPPTPAGGTLHPEASRDKRNPASFYKLPLTRDPHLAMALEPKPAATTRKPWGTLADKLRWDAAAAGPAAAVEAQPKEPQTTRAPQELE